MMGSVSDGLLAGVTGKHPAKLTSWMSFVSLLIVLVTVCGQVSYAGPINEDALYYYRAEITDVYDGDTVSVNIDLGFSTWLHDQKLRLFGINTPEVKGDEKDRGIKSRDFLRAKLLGKTIILQSHPGHKGEIWSLLGGHLARRRQRQRVASQFRIRRSPRVLRRHPKKSSDKKTRIRPPRGASLWPPRGRKSCYSPAIVARFHAPALSFDRQLGRSPSQRCTLAAISLLEN